jgi:hypothetical protein
MDSAQAGANAALLPGYDTEFECYIDRAQMG